MLTSLTTIFQAHGRPTLRSLVQEWNKVLQKEMEHAPSTKTDAAAAFLASLEGPKLTSLADAAKKPPIEILPPGMASLYGPIPGQGKPPALQGSKQQQMGKQLLLEGPNATTQNGPAQAESSVGPPAPVADAPPPTSVAGTPPNSEVGAADTSQSSTPPKPETGAALTSESGVVPSEPDASVPPPESNPQAAAESNEKTEDKQSPVSSTPGADPTIPVAEENAPSSQSMIISSSSSTVTAPQPPNNQGTVVKAEPLMIDFS